MDNERYYQAVEIYSRPATKKQPARRGKLPISRTWFYELLKTGKFPKADAVIGETRLWSDKLLKSALVSGAQDQQ